MYIFPRFSAQSAEKPENTKYNLSAAMNFFVLNQSFDIKLSRQRVGQETTVLPSYKVSF